MFKILSSKRSDEAYREVTKDYDNLIKIIAAFNGKEYTPINRESLMTFPEGVWVEVNDKVKVRRRKHRFHDHLNFDTIMAKGGEFGKHFHNDVLESAEVLYGKMQDLQDNKIYLKGDVMEYAKGQKHTPIALEETKLHVLFKP